MAAWKGGGVGGISAVVFSHGWGLRSDMWWQHSATLLTQPASPGYWGLVRPGLDYLQACVPLESISLRTPWEKKKTSSRGFLIGSRASFINGTDYMQGFFFFSSPSHAPMIINGCCRIKRLIWPARYCMSAWKEEYISITKSQGVEEKAVVRTSRKKERDFFFTSSLFFFFFAGSNLTL